MATIAETAQRLAEVLGGGGHLLADATGSDLEFFPDVQVRPLEALAAPERCWGVDGGQALVADARCLQVVATRAARTLWSGGSCTLEEQGDLMVHLLSGSGGGAEGQRALAELGAPVPPGGPVDLNLLRDWSEWDLVRHCVEGEGTPGALVLVDGDLQPDWRVPASWLAELLDSAGRRGVHLVGVTKHSSLSRGGAPLVGQLELEAERSLGPRARWWAPIARRRPEVGPGLLVVVAKLDPDARFAFRVDIAAAASTAVAVGSDFAAITAGAAGTAGTAVTDFAAGTSVAPGASVAPGTEFAADTELVLGQLCALCDDAGFPGYPYPLSVADRLAACSGWARQEAWAELDTALVLAGLAPEVKDRAFADRHNFMERS